MYDDYDLWEDRMKLYLESVSEGDRSLAILGQLDSDVYAVARATNITSSLTTATIFERLRREFGRSPMPWVARAALRERRQHSGESVVDFQRHLRVLAKQAYPDDSCSALEDRILDNFVDGIANLDIRRKFMLDPPKTLKAALDSARDEECPRVPDSKLLHRKAKWSMSSPWDHDRLATLGRKPRDGSGIPNHSPPLDMTTSDLLLDVETGGINEVVGLALNTGPVFIRSPQVRKKKADRERPFATEITVHFNRLKLGERPDAYGPEDQGNIVCDVDRDQVGRIVEIPPEGGDEFEVPFSDRRHNLEDHRSMLHDTSQNEGTAIAEDSDVSMEEGVIERIAYYNVQNETVGIVQYFFIRPSKNDLNSKIDPEEASCAMREEKFNGTH
ncbi:hypothetical protein SprV_0100387600 [Sparganum proliferum]